ncbi:putative RNA-binding Zn-ribbon protein involved in translation (DUF1610 family) [Paenibacillus polymyxa]|uniref:TnsD family Tn7-like transposition protein n=1 Tax=Paenibacillus polymyxa TaxID=1406 RepID=UPI002793BA2E|nr:TnsD family Tn7-like transposition protein [Paenibacillus polymyxa]MDQ0049891.1 putative RNA-binding Zn-ribbon protein involved in translation (DUF1610 family) [Paenibacillus polymyxa]
MGNIIYFPSPYPDEDYRSIVYRYYLYSPYPTYARSLQNLYAERPPQKVSFPQNLSRLLDDLNVSKSFTERLIQEHTFYPLLKVLITQEKHQNYMQGMYDKLAASAVLPNRMHYAKILVHPQERYCPKCVEEDYKRYQTVYLHRSHQFMFLTQCPIHGSILIHTCPECDIPLTKEGSSQMLIDQFCPNGHNITCFDKPMDIKEDERQLLADISAIMDWETISLEMLYTKLMVITGARGYIHFRGDFIYKKKLLQDLIKYYGTAYLENLGIIPEQLIQQNSIVQFLQKSNISSNILIYILLIRYFSGSVENFLMSNETYANPVPFGNGPWLCINTICTKYNQRVIYSCKRKIHEWVTGTFTCPHCGITYSRKGYPHKEDENQYTIDTMGFLFIDKAVQYFEEGMNLQEIAQKLLSNKTTIRKYMQPHRGIQSKVYQGNVEAAKVIELGYHEAAAAINPKLELCKETILEAIKFVAGQGGRPEIRKFNMHRYDWLMKHDRAWMEEHLPPRKEFIRKVNRNARETEIYSLLKNTIDKVRSNPPRHQIKASLFFKDIPSNLKSYYYNPQIKLPKIKSLIEQSIESDDEYAVRVFPQVVEWFQKSRYRRLSLRLAQRHFPVYKRCSKDIKAWFLNEANKYYK